MSIFEELMLSEGAFNGTLCAGHDVRVEGLSPLWAEIERSIS